MGLVANRLEEDFRYYLKYQKDFVERYDGQFLVIKDQAVLGAYPTVEAAYLDTIKTHEPGTFLIQKCSPGQEDYTATFHSRVSFS